MKILSLWQPWASAFAYGWKFHETREWETPYRGKVAIHAAVTVPAKKACEWARQILAGIHRSDISAREGFNAEAFPVGAIIAVGTLVQIVSTSEAKSGFLDRAFGDYSPGRFAWRFENIYAVEPYPWKGAQGIRELPPEVEANLKPVVSSDSISL